jgi:hypothetical protein
MTAEGRDPVDLFASTEREAMNPDQPAAQALEDPSRTASLPPGALATPEAATADTKSLPQLPAHTETWNPRRQSRQSARRQVRTWRPPSRR